MAKFDQNYVDYVDINRQDNPFVQDGAINFRKYCEVNNFNGIDYCIIHMNWNAFGYGENEMWRTLKELADKVLESYPNCKIFIVGMSAYSKYKYTGYWYCTKETVWNIDRKYQEECDKLDNFRYISLLPYRDMDKRESIKTGMETIADMYGCRLIDTSRIIGVGSRNKNKWMVDYIHGTDARNEKFGKYMVKEIEMSLFN